MQILVIGMHRSGTSVVSRLLNMMGCYFGPEGKGMLPGEDNPKGFWERLDVVELNDKILSSTKSNWHNVSDFNLDEIGGAERNIFEKEIQKIIYQLDSQRPWYLKDPRMCLTMPLWLSQLEIPVPIIVYRDPLDVASSLKKRNNIPLHAGIALWEFYTISALKYLPRDPYIINFADLLADPLEETAGVYKFLLGKNVQCLHMPSDAEILSFIDHDLVNTPKSEDVGFELFNGQQRQLVAYLQGREDLPDIIGLSPGSTEILAEYAAQQEDKEKIKLLNISHDQTKNDIDEINKKYSKLAEKNQLIENNLITAVQENALKDKWLDAEIKSHQALQGKYDWLQHETVRKLQENSLEAERAERALETQLHKLQESFDEKVRHLSKSNLLLDDKLNQLQAANQKISELQGISEILDGHLKVLQNELAAEEDQIAQYDSWMQELNRDIIAVFNSTRWRVGNAIGAVGGLAKLRFNQPTGREHIEAVLAEYRSAGFSHENDKFTEQDGFDQEYEEGRWSFFCSLLIAALKNPDRAARMVSFNRLRNFYLTMFKHSPHVRRNIFDYYQDQLADLAQKQSHSVSSIIDEINNESQSLRIPEKDNPQVSIIIPAFNQWNFTEKCIRSIILYCHGLDYEIILADDNSDDETITAEDVFPGLRVVRPEINLGFLKNCNNAAKEARGDFLVFLNNDTVVHPNWLQALLDVFDVDDKAGMAGSKLIYPDGKLQEAGGIVWQDGSGWNYGRLDDPDKPEYNYIKEVDYISGASIIIKTDLWRSIGGFDEEFAPAYYEDTDLAFMVRKNGYKVVYTPFSAVTHFEGQSHGVDEEAGIKKFQQINNKKFYLKWKDKLKHDHGRDSGDLFVARDRSVHRKTILVIDHYVPHFDKDAGSISTWQYLKWFVGSGFNVKFIGDNFFQHEPYTEHLQKRGIEVLHGNWYAENWQQWMGENGSYIDYIYLHRPHIAPKYIEAAKEAGAKLLYFGHDLHYLRLMRQAEVNNDDNMLKLAKDWKEKEFSIFEEVDVVYYPSQVEVDKIKKHLPDKTIRAIPLYILDHVKRDKPSYEQRSGLMFIGGFAHEPNIDAITWFVKEIFPVIFNADKSIKLTIIGSKPPLEVSRLASSNIKVLGEVSDDELDKVYSNTRLSVVPLRYGAGIKGKILEALAHQLAVVTTDIGAEGLPGHTGYLSVANDSEAFANKVLDIYHDREKWDLKVGNGVECLNKYFSVENVQKIVGQDFDMEVDENNGDDQ